MAKRVKSFLITLSSLVGTALFAVVLTPEWSAFLQLAKDKLAEWGIPAVILAVIGVFVSEVWKQVLNYRIQNKAMENGLSVGDSLNNFNNELY